MAWEVTVSDRYSGWGAGGKIFRPGTYIVFDEAIAEAAASSEGVTVREVVGGSADGTGEITCPQCGGGPFGSRRSLRRHLKRAHP